MDVVTLASNVHGVPVVEKVKRWSSSQKKRVEVRQPATITFYNTYMGGTDHIDQSVSCRRTSVQTYKRWWRALSVYFLAVVLHNGYYTCTNGRLRISVRRDNVDVYRKKYTFNNFRSGNWPLHSTIAWQTDQNQMWCVICSTRLFKQPSFPTGDFVPQPH